jgi:ABC-2 type transport system ATP-binding protein
VVVESVVKSYGSRKALDGLSFEVQPGEVFALLGPNGAGKTTTVESLEGYRRPDAGRVRVLGLDPSRDAGRLTPRMGVMLQEGGLYPAITPREALALFSRFYPQPRPADELLCLVGLEEAAGTRYRRLSGGQKQRLALALALVGRPEIVFLDEPTSGMDPQARRTTWEVVSQLRAGGVTLLLTTHYLEEAERLADHVAIIDRGRLVALGTPAELVTGNSSTVRLRTVAPVDLETLSGLPSASQVQADGGNTYLLETSDAPSLLIEVTTALRDRQIGVAELRVGFGSLEDVFLQLTDVEGSA